MVGNPWPARTESMAWADVVVINWHRHRKPAYAVTCRRASRMSSKRHFYSTSWDTCHGCGHEVIVLERLHAAHPDSQTGAVRSLRAVDIEHPAGLPYVGLVERQPLSDPHLHTMPALQRHSSLEVW